MKQLAVLILLLAGCAATTPAPAPEPAPPARVLAEIERIEKLVADDPSNTPYMYILARYYDIAKDTKNAVRWLTHLDSVGWQLGLGPDAFENSESDPAFQAIAAKLAAREIRASRGAEAFRFRNVDSEGIAYDPVDDVFYFSGGAAKLLRVSRTGEITEVAIEPPGEKFGRLGMDVDAARRQLWVVNAVFNPDADVNKGVSAISVHALPDMRVVRRVMRGNAEQPSFFNDMTLMQDGTAFITDTGRNEVVRLAPGADSFETIATDFIAPNGIAMSADEQKLYVADFRGLNEIVLATNARRVLETSTPLNGIDGLIEHRGTLIGIHNVLGRARVVRVHLDDSNRVELLESANPLLNNPATGVVAGDSYYFLPGKGQKDVDQVVLRIPL